MIEEFRKYLSDNNLINRSERVLLTVSGGIDSMVMTHLFLDSGIEIGIAHCNFCLRGKESDKDESFVRNYALRNKVPFFLAKFDTSGFATERGISIQMAARELRYRWFEEIRMQNNYDLIAVAHNNNDNTETFLINLTRGTGIAGLTGMKPKHNHIIRPLLFASRNAIVAYSEQNKVKYREDLSNADTKYTRNKIRHKVLPVLKEINPSIDTAITETAERLSEINDIFSEMIEGIKTRVTVKKDNQVIFKTSELLALRPARTIVFELFRPYGLTTGQIDDLLKMRSGKSGGRILTHGYRIIKNRQEIIVTPDETASGGHFRITDIDDFHKVPFTMSAALKKITTGFRIPVSEYIACLDADKVTFPMIIRKWQKGDSFYPLGMKQKKKLSDFFIDNKYSLPDKENCHLLVSGGKIVWIIGKRIDNRFSIKPSSKKALIIKVKG